MKPNHFTFLLISIFLVGTMSSLRSQVIWSTDPTKSLTTVFYRFDITGYTTGTSCLDKDAPNPTASTPIDPIYGKHWQINKPANRKRAEFARSNGLILSEGLDCYLGWRWKLTSIPRLNQGLAIFQYKTEDGSAGPDTQNYPFNLSYDGTTVSLNCYGPGYPDWSVGSSITNRLTTVWQKAVSQNEWVSFVFHIKVSRDPTIGFIEFWFNDVQQTLTNSNYKEYQVVLSADKKRAYHKTNDGNQVYFKWGAYGGSACNFDITTDYVDLRAGNTYEDAKPSEVTSSIAKNFMDNNDVSIYPNPASSSFTIDLNSKEMARISIFNMSGQRIYSMVPTSNKFEIPAKDKFQQGIYQVQMIDKLGSFYSQKLIIK